MSQTNKYTFIRRAATDRHSQDIPDQYGNSQPEYQWYFQLLLEDMSLRRSSNDKHNLIWVNVPHQKAVELLGEDLSTPVNLRKNRHMVQKLRNRLFALWGNLEQKKLHDVKDRFPLASMPFRCSIFEYGVPMDDFHLAAVPTPGGFKRVYRMDKCQILAQDDVSDQGA
jgi:hypothetical protein